MCEELFWCSQASAVQRWCEALKADTLKISKRASATGKRNQELEVEAKKIRNTLSTQNRDHEVAMDKLKRKSTSLALELSNEKKEKAELLKSKNLAESRLKELELQITQRDADMKKEALERTRLQFAASGFEKLQQELKQNQATSCQNLNKIKAHLEDEKKSKDMLKTKLLKLEHDKRVQSEEFEKQAQLLADTIDENQSLKAEVGKIRSELGRTMKESKEQREELSVKAQTLDTELKKCQSKIHLLTLYPDLNGPINPPKSDDEDVLLTMQNQFQANEARTQILLEQNERLSGTIKKLRTYMQKRSMPAV